MGRPFDATAVPDLWQLGTGEEPARLAILGCGGAGCNTLRQVALLPHGVCVAVNHAPHPAMAGLPRVLVRPDSLRAFASMDERAVQKMETHEEKDLATAILDRDLVLPMGGLGGEIGGWAMSLVGRVARILGDATLALATVPFTAEGALRRTAAERQLDLLRRKVDGVVTFGNDELLRIAPDVPLVRAFKILGGVMAKLAGALALGLSRSDIAPLRRQLTKARDWRFGMGAGAEKHRCFLAVEEAYRSPWFTGRHEDIRQAAVLMSLPPPSAPEEVIREVHLRSPGADVAWGTLPESPGSDRAIVNILAGM